MDIEEEDIVSRQCGRCGDIYQEQGNVGRWQCRTHVPGAMVNARDGRYSCCGLASGPRSLVYRIPPGRLTESPIGANAPAAHLDVGCMPLDHDVVPPMAAVPMRAWAQDYLILVRPEALVRGPPAAVAMALGANHVFIGPNAADAREIFWAMALRDPAFFAFVGAEARETWLKHDELLAEEQRPPLRLRNLDPVQLGLVVAVARHAPGPGTDALGYALAMRAILEDPEY